MAFLFLYSLKFVFSKLLDTQGESRAGSKSLDLACSGDLENKFPYLLE